MIIGKFVCSLRFHCSLIPVQLSTLVHNMNTQSGGCVVFVQCSYRASVVCLIVNQTQSPIVYMYHSSCRIREAMTPPCL